MLYKRGNIWWVKIKFRGEEIRRSSGSSIKREAAQFERQIRNEIAELQHQERTGKPVNKTYGEAVVQWAKSGAPKSMLSHARNTRLYLEDVKLHLVVPAAHEMKRHMLENDYSPLTINRRLAVVRRVLNMAYKEWEWIKEPLGRKIQLLSEKSLSREFYLSQEEVNNLLSHVKNEEAYKVITLAAYTGLRRGELLKLKPSNWQPPYIILDNKTKGKRGRSIPVINAVQKLVTPPFKITEHELRVSFETAREAIQRPEIRFHDLRHTFASWLAKNPDIPLTTIRDILGHSNLTVTSKYAHLRGDAFDLVSRALDAKNDD